MLHLIPFSYGHLLLAYTLKSCLFFITDFLFITKGYRVQLPQDNDACRQSTEQALNSAIFISALIYPNNAFQRYDEN